jgi:hypothetical protein
MAFDIAAVSPFLNASKRRNSFTDCSREEAVGDGGGIVVGSEGEEGLETSCADMVVDRCGL